MSKRPATFRTARCSSRIDVYCCGSSHPPKSTMRPPRATWRSYRGVRLAALTVKLSGLVFVDVEFDCLGIDEGEQLFVMPAPRVGDNLGHVARAVDGPFELLGQLIDRRLAMQLPAQGHVGLFVVGRSGDEKLCIANGRCLPCDRSVHVRADSLLGESYEVGPAGTGERAHGLDQANRSFLDQVGDREALVSSKRGQPNDHVQMSGHEPVLAT